MTWLIAALCFMVSAPRGAHGLLLFASNLLEQAQAAEAAGDPARAVELYRDALEHEQSSRTARRIRTRLSWLEARREGNYQPLAALMRLQARPRASLSREELDTFGTAVEDFPEGLVRRESHALLASAYLDRFDDPQAALRHYEAWLASPNIDEAERRLAIAGIARTRARLEGEDSALQHLERAGYGDRTEAVAFRAKRIGQMGSWISLTLVATFVASGLALGGWRGFRRLRLALSPKRILLAAYVLLCPLALITVYDARLAKRFGSVILAMTVVLAFSTTIGAAPSIQWRRSLAALAAIATFAAAFVALHNSRLLFDIMLAIEQAG